MQLEMPKASIDNIRSLNQVIKEVYKYYVYKDGLIIPSDMGQISSPKLFTNSIFIHHETADFLNNAILDPKVISKAIGDRCYEYGVKPDGKRVLRNSKKDLRYEFGFDIDEHHDADFDHNPGLSALNDFNSKHDKYDICWEMSADVKSILLDYGVMKNCIGTCKGHDVNLVMTKKIFPAIKKADEISIFAKLHNEEERTYKFVIISRADDWTFYSFHRLINIP